MAKYLFRFAYCTPTQWKANDEHGWDDESSSAVFVKADSREEALRWGEVVAEHFVSMIFAKDNSMQSAPSWKDSGFAYWIEEFPESVYSLDRLGQIPAVEHGELPDLQALE